MISYARIIIIFVVLSVAFAMGWTVRNRDYQDFKKEVSNAAKAQEAYNESVKKQQAIANKGITDAYEAKLSSLKSYYGGLRQSSSGKLPSISDPSSGVNESATDQLLACAYTTQQLISLQDWINIQVSIK